MILRKEEVIEERETDFMEELRCWPGGFDFGLPEGVAEELWSIREVALANDDYLNRLISLNPNSERFYRNQHAEAEAELEARVLALHLPWIERGS